MVRKLEDARIETRENMRGGNGTVVLKHLVEGNESFDKSRMIALFEFAPGASIGEHAHVKDAEVFIIAEGTATVTDDENTYELNEGDVLFTGNGSKHSVFNNSSKTLKLYAAIFN